jgi:hypothetical protein
MDKCLAGALGGALVGGAANFGPAVKLIGSLGDGFWGFLAGGLLEAASTIGGALSGAAANGCFDSPPPSGGPLVGISTGRGVRITAALLFVPVIAGGLLSWKHDPSILVKAIVLAEGGALLQFVLGFYLLWKKRAK